MFWCLHRALACAVPVQQILRSREDLLACCNIANYLIVTIICEYKILRFWDSDDFAGIKFLLFHEVELNFCDFAQAKVKAQL